MSKASDNVIKSAEAATEPGVLSKAADTAAPNPSGDPNVKPQGDGAAPYREDFKAVYARLTTLEELFEELLGKLDKATVTTHDPHAVSLEARLSNIETRLHQMAEGAGEAKPGDKGMGHRLKRVEERLDAQFGAEAQ